ncbi:MAG: hypothetical protein E6Q53_01150 [Candidatus Moraniibacteriota bacterium]|nr:MAG: hypothetical protein E6Q53_01150 [Candidatus Moranbacteria bacterium]
MKRFSLLIVLLAIALMACRCSVDGNGFSFAFDDPTPETCTTCQPQNTVTPAPTNTPRPTEEVSIPTPTGWVGDQFGPEQALPALVVGPAVAEIYRPSDNYCALVKINKGETLDWRAKGAWWQAFSQEALDARFPHHQAEYVKNQPACKVLQSAQDVH